MCVAAPHDAAHSCWRQPKMHAMNDMGVPRSVAMESMDINEHNDAEVLKVSAHSRPSAVAGAIAGVIRSHGRADVQAIGAGATNQAIKAVAIARDYLQPNGIDIVVIPAFIDVQIADEERTAIRLVVEARS